MKKRQQHTLSRNTVFETKWFSIDAVSYESPDKEPYYRLSCDDSVSVIAKTIENKIILIRQYRPAIEAYTLELPSGYMNEGEIPEEAMKRELTEETGYICGSLLSMGSWKICPSRVNNTVHIFFGNNAALVQEKAIEDKDVELVLVTMEEFKELILEGKYIEAAGIAMFFLAQEKGYLSSV